MSGGKKKPRPFAFVLDDTLARLPIHGMPPAERSVLRAIATHAGPDGEGAFPSFDRLSRLTGLGVSTVAKTIKVLCDRAWLTRESRRDPDTGASTSNVYRVVLDGKPWGEEQARKRKRNPPSNRRTPPIQSAQPGQGVQSADTPHPIGAVTGVQSAEGGCPPDAKDPFSNPPREPPINPPSRPHARAGGQQSLLPDLETSTAKATEPKEPKPAKPPRVKAPKAEDLYAEAYVAGHRDAGFSMTPLSKSERGLLGPIAATHARFRDDSPITGDLLLRWIRERARDFRDFVCEKSGFRSNVSPFGFRAWLDAGHDGAKRWRPPGAEAAPPPEPPRLPNRPPPGLVGSPREALAALEANSYVPRAAVETLRRDIERREALAAQEGQAAHG